MKKGKYIRDREIREINVLVKSGILRGEGMIDVAKKKREINKNSPKYKYIWKREKFGYLLGIARGVWGIQNSK